jgi:hypothetical protein
MSAGGLDVEAAPAYCRLGQPGRLMRAGSRRDSDGFVGTHGITDYSDLRRP